jgi:hypothetical protein
MKTLELNISIDEQAFMEAGRLLERARRKRMQRSKIRGNIPEIREKGS